MLLSPFDHGHRLEVLKKLLFHDYPLDSPHLLDWILKCACNRTYKIDRNNVKWSQETIREGTQKQLLNIDASHSKQKTDFKK